MRVLNFPFTGFKFTFIFIFFFLKRTLCSNETMNECKRKKKKNSRNDCLSMTSLTFRLTPFNMIIWYPKFDNLKSSAQFNNFVCALYIRYLIFTRLSRNVKEKVSKLFKVDRNTEHENPSGKSFFLHNFVSRSKNHYFSGTIFRVHTSKAVNRMYIAVQADWTRNKRRRNNKKYNE